MQTFKEVLSRESERQNLQSVGICLLAVLVLTVSAFGLVYLKSFATPFASEATTANTEGEFAGKGW